MTEMHRVQVPFTSRRAAVNLARHRMLLHSLGESGRGVGAALPPFLDVPTAGGPERIGTALRSVLRGPEDSGGQPSASRLVASSRQPRLWPTWARTLVRSALCCIVVGSHMGIAIVPTRKWPTREKPRDFLDLEGKITWLAPSASDTALGAALIESFAKCE